MRAYVNSRQYIEGLDFEVELTKNPISTNWSLIPQEYENVVAFDFLDVSHPSKINYPDAPRLVEVLSDVCKQKNDFSNAEMVNILSAASPGEIAAVTSAAESVCNGAGELDPKKLLYDSLVHCRLGKCLAQAHVLQRKNGYDDLPELLMNRGLFYNDNDSENNREVLKHFYEFAKNNLSRDLTKLVLGTLINDVCQVDSNCRSRSIVKQAVDLLESLISQNCQEREDLVLLKALGNGGVFNDMKIISERCAVLGDEETISTAIDAMRKTACTDERFDFLTGIMEENINPAEIRQMALLTLWKCPSTELRDYLLQAKIDEESSDMLNLMKTLNVKHDNLMGMNTSDWSALLSGNSMVFKHDYIQFEKLNNPGSIIPRRLNIDITNFLKFGFGFINGNDIMELKENLDNNNDPSLELRFRAVNLENELIKIFNSNYDFDENTFGQRGGEFEQPQLRLDIRVNDNDVFSIQIEDIKALFIQIAEDYKNTVNLSIFDKMKVVLGYDIGLLKYLKSENFDFQRTFWLPLGLSRSSDAESREHAFFQEIVYESFKHLQNTMTTFKMKTDISLDNDWRFVLNGLIKTEKANLILIENTFLKRLNNFAVTVEEFQVVFGKQGWRLAHKMNSELTGNSLEYSNVDGFSLVLKNSGDVVSLVYSKSNGELEVLLTSENSWTESFKGYIKSVDGELRGSLTDSHGGNYSARLYDQVPTKERSILNMKPTAELENKSDGSRVEISLENRENIVRLFGVMFSKNKVFIDQIDDEHDLSSSILSSSDSSVGVWGSDISAVRPSRSFMNRTLAILDGKYDENETIEEFVELKFTRTVEIGKASGAMSFITDSQFGAQAFFQTGITVEDDKANVSINFELKNIATADFELNSNWRSGKDFTKYFVKISQLDVKSDMINVHFDKGKMSFTQNHVQKSKCPADKGGFISPQKEVEGTFDLRFDQG